MEKLVIAGFAGIGKTTLGKKYKNVIDLDSSKYAYDDSDLENLSIEERKGLPRRKNKKWPDNYIKAILDALNTYDFVLVWEREDILEEYQKHHIPFVLCYPNRNSLETYQKRYKDRGNSEIYIKKKIEQYKRRIHDFESMKVDKIILSNEETLEDYLLKKGYQLKK